MVWFLLLMLVENFAKLNIDIAEYFQCKFHLNQTKKAFFFFCLSVVVRRTLSSSLLQQLPNQFYVGKEQSLLMSSLFPLAQHGWASTSVWRGVKPVGVDKRRVWAVRFNHADRATCYFFLSCWFLSILGSVNEEPSAEYLGFRAAQSVQRSGFAKF